MSKGSTSLESLDWKRSVGLPLSKAEELAEEIAKTLPSLAYYYAPPHPALRKRSGQWWRFEPTVDVYYAKEDAALQGVVRGYIRETQPYGSTADYWCKEVEHALRRVYTEWPDNARWSCDGHTPAPVPPRAGFARAVFNDGAAGSAAMARAQAQS